MNTGIEEGFPLRQLIDAIDQILFHFTAAEQALQCADDDDIPSAKRREMRALVDEMWARGDHLMDLASAVAHGQPDAPEN